MTIESDVNQHKEKRFVKKKKIIDMTVPFQHIRPIPKIIGQYE
jgi:hypothetical protein